MNSKTTKRGTRVIFMHFITVASLLYDLLGKEKEKKEKCDNIGCVDMRKDFYSSWNSDDRFIRKKKEKLNCT